MLRLSVLPCAVIAVCLASCSSDSVSQSPGVVDAGTPSEEAQPDTGEKPETTTEDALAEAAEEEDAAQDAAAEPVPSEAAAGTKKAGESCTDAYECADNMNCVSGQYTPAHCNPNCTTEADCAASAPGAKGSCQNGGSINFCMYYCGMMGGTCPGDLKCDGAVCG